MILEIKSTIENWLISKLINGHLLEDKGCHRYERIIKATKEMDYKIRLEGYLNGQGRLERIQKPNTK